jgi:predicted transposase YdaD
MLHRYDAAIKTLIEQYPADWLRTLGVPVEGPVSLLEADLSTVSADADKLLFVEQPEPTLINLELQSSRDPDLPCRLLLYAALAFYRHRLRMLGVVVLLRREADFPELTGQAGYEAELGGKLAYEYRVVRLWEQSPEWALAGGLGTIPLAPLTRVTAAELPGVIRQMETRLEKTPAPVRDTLWTTTYILMGLRYPEAISQRVLREVRSMKDSVTYQGILREGREEGERLGREAEAREMLLRLGERRFGVPGIGVAQTLEALPLERLHALSLRLLDVESWDELLAE